MGARSIMRRGGSSHLASSKDIACLPYQLHGLRTGSLASSPSLMSIPKCRHAMMRRRSNLTLIASLSLSSTSIEVYHYDTFE